MNQAAGETGVPEKVSPFVTPELVTPTITPVQESVQVIAPITQSLEQYLTQDVIDVVDDTNTEGQSNNEIGRNSIETNIVINEAGIRQPLKSIGEMLNELPRGTSSEISEMNIVVSTSIYE